jgi:hypothetical protein
MKQAPQPPQETLRLELDATTFKAFLRDLLFREAGKPYFKRLALPRRHRFLGAWRTLPTYQAERQLLPVGGRHIDQLIRQFFISHARLRAEFQDTGMPVSAIHVLHQRCPARNAALERIRYLECALDDPLGYSLLLTGGPAPPCASEARRAQPEDVR